MVTIKEIITELPKKWAWFWKETIGKYMVGFYRSFVLTLLGGAFFFPPYAVLAVAVANILIEGFCYLLTKEGFRYITLFVSGVGIVMGYFVTWVLANYGVTFHAI